MAIDERFFLFSPRAASDIAESLGLEIHGSGAVMITGAAPLHEAGAGDLTFLGESADLPEGQLAGAIVIAGAGVAAGLSDDTVLLVSEAPRRDFALALAQLVGERDGEVPLMPATALPDVRIDPGVAIGRNVEIGKGSVVEAGAVLHHGISIGRNCRIGANAVLSHCNLDDDVVIGAGCVVGGQGFGFEITPEGAVLLPHVGSVSIGGATRIGSGCTIDRGTLGPTSIGRGVMMDNLVHVAHNCVIRENAVLAAQVGLAGGAVIGRGAMLAGQVGVSSKVSVGDGAVVMGQSGVTKDVPANTTVVGFPAVEAREAWRERAALRRLIAKSSKKET